MEIWAREIWARRPRYSPGWIKQIQISLPLYRLPDRPAGKVWTERRATGDLRGIVYGGAEVSLHVLTSRCPARSSGPCCRPAPGRRPCRWISAVRWSSSMAWNPRMAGPPVPSSLATASASSASIGPSAD